MVFSQLYTFMPYHFFRGESHLFIATYYMVPLAAMVALWISSAELLKAGSTTRKFNFLSRKFAVAVVVCLLTSSVGLGYYAFFSCFFILVGAGIASISLRSFKPLLPGLILVALIFVGLLVNLTPSLWYQHKHGKVNVIQRAPEESELYGLKIAPMLLPVRNHRIPAFAALTERYRVATFSNESGSATLGLIGSAGFLFLFSWLFFRRSDAALPNRPLGLLHRLSIMAAAAVLLGTVGGFSALFAFIISPQIRTYNRISIFIAFFSLLAVALVLDELLRRKDRWPRALRYGLLGLILVVGILDQTNKYFVPAYAQNKAEFENDQRFVDAIEQRLPAAAMLFQLPYVQFPENPQVKRMGDYELFKGYLHSKRLRWSYGAMKSREGDIWLRDTSEKPLPEMLENVAIVGFKGIYLDRFGYSESNSIENRLRELLSEAPLVSSDQRLVFFDLTEFSDRVLKNYSADELTRKRESIMHPLVLTWSDGFSDLEGNPDDNWRWSSNSGKLTITNTSTRARTLQLEMKLFSGYKQPANMRVKSKEFSDAFPINSDGKTYSRTIAIQPGASVAISFECDGERIVAPADPRALIFKVANFQWKEI
jgi:phosphoglycerol transferase